MSQPIRGQGGHLVFPIGRENTNLVEDVDILLPVKFLWIQFSGFRREVENASVNQRPGWPSCFSDRPKKHKLGRGRWDLASCQVSFNCVQRFQRRSWKSLSRSDARAAILFLRLAPKHKLGRGRWDLASCQGSLNSVKRFQRRSRKCLSRSDARVTILLFPIGPKTQTWEWTLRSCFLSSFVEFLSVVSEKKSNRWKVNDGRTTDNSFGSGALKMAILTKSNMEHFSTDQPKSIVELGYMCLPPYLYLYQVVEIQNRDFFLTDTSFLPERFCCCKNREMYFATMGQVKPYIIRHIL